MRSRSFIFAAFFLFSLSISAFAAEPAPTPKPTPKRMEDMTKEEIENLSDEEAINAEDAMQKRKYAAAEQLRVQANALIDQGKDRDAIPLLNKARELNPNDTRVLAAGAVALLHMGDLANAEGAANAGVNSFFKSADAYDALGQVQTAKKDLTAANDSFAKSLGIDDKFAPAYLHRGVAKALINDNAGAIADYTRAIQLDPKLIDAYFKRSYLYIFVTNEPAKGIADLDTFLTLRPNESYAYSNRACGYFNLKQIDRSLADNNKAIELSAQNKFAFANRGLIYAQQGKYALAKADYQKALEIDPNFRLAKDRLAELEKNNSTADALLNDKTDLKKLGFKVEPKASATPSSSVPSTKELDKLMDGLEPKPVSTDFSSALKPSAKAAPGNNKADDALNKAIADNKLDGSIKYDDLKKLSAKENSTTNAAAANAGKKYADAMAAYNDGMDLAAKGDLDGSLAAFKTAVEMDPKFVRAQNNVGAMYAKKNDLESSMHAYLQALNIDPKFEMSLNNLEGIIGRIKDALNAGTLKLSKQGFTNYYTARNKVYIRMITNYDNAAYYELNRRSSTLDCSKLQTAYEGHTRFDTYLRDLKDDYEKGNTTYTPEELKLLPQMVEVNNRKRSEWFDTMHKSGCIVRGFDPVF